MATYVILSRLTPGTFRDPKDFRKTAADVAAMIKEHCPGVHWKQSYATMGRYDIVDIVEADDPAAVQKAAMIIHGHGDAMTETLLATPWDTFLQRL